MKATAVIWYIATMAGLGLSALFGEVPGTIVFAVLAMQAHTIMLKQVDGDD